MTAGADQIHEPARPSILRLLRHEFVTPEAIYGTVLMTVIITNQEDEHPALQGLVIGTLTAFVFWLAHVFAHTVARHGVARGRETSLGTAVREAVFHSTGFLTGSIVPLALLGLAPLGLVSEPVAYELAADASILVLFTLGALALAERGKRWYACLLGGLFTAGVGFLVILLELIVH